jgi:hypothetical protein
VLNPVNTKMTFGHLPTLKVSGCTKGAGESTAVTAYTNILVDIHNTILVSFIDGARGTDHHTRGISTMLASKGKKRHAYGRELSFLQPRHMPETQTVAGEIVFILARHDTRHTTTAARDIEGESDLHIL